MVLERYTPLPALPGRAQPCDVDTLVDTGHSGNSGKKTKSIKASKRMLKEIESFWSWSHEPEALTMHSLHPVTD